MSRIMALAGPPGSGKSTIARALGAYGFERVPFAAPLKAMMRGFYEAVGVSSEVIEAKLNGCLKETSCGFLGGQTPRWAQQTLGTGWGRDLIALDLWVSAWRTAALNHIGGGAPGVVADDCRFPNEAAMIRCMGGIVVEVRRPGVFYSGRHASEAGGLDVDAVLSNDDDPAVVAARLMDSCPAM